MTPASLLDPVRSRELVSTGTRHRADRRPPTRGTTVHKLTMAVTGLVLVAYVVSHVLANLLAYAGPTYINGYGRLLHATGPLLWVVRAVLLAAAVLHVRAAVLLTRQAQAARGRRYERRLRQASPFATRTIRWGGALLLLFLLVHVPMFTGGALHPAFVGGDDFHNVVHAFRNPWIAALNALASVVAGLHVYHGVRAAPATLGATARAARAARLVRHAARAVALFIGVGFASIPIAVLTGVLRD